MREIMDCNDDPLLEEIMFMASAQVSKSESMNNMVGKTVDIEPCPIMIVQPRIEDAEGYSKKRIATMIRDTPSLKSKFAPVRSKDSFNSILFKKFVGGFLKLCGANAPASLASDSIKKLFMDEIDRMIEATSEGDPCELAKKRTNNFRGRKIFYFSTPTEKKTSRIYKLWLQSDQRYYMMPCPHCAKLIRFQWKTDDGTQVMRWDNDDPKTAHMICVECGERIDESSKFSMMEIGVWVPTNPAGNIRGYHIWEAYSPWRRWSEIVSDFLKVKDYPESLKVWINTSLGWVWERKDGDIPDWKRLYDRRETYTIGTVPNEVGFVTGAADVQGDRIEVEFRFWTRGRRVWSVYKEIIPGNPALSDEPWNRLDELIARQWMRPDGSTIATRVFGVDSGALTQRVYNFVRRYPPHRVFALKGRDSLQQMAVAGNKVDVNVRGQKLKRSLRVWLVGTNMIKDEIMGFLRIEKPLDGQPFPHGYYHFPEYEEEYFKQLVSEHIELDRDKRGYNHWVWKKHHERNEILDLAVYNRALAHLVGIDRMQDEDWDKVHFNSSQAPAPAATSAVNSQSDKRKDRKPKERSDYWARRR
jgi:phage terminase large subunit GpA-like protein